MKTSSGATAVLIVHSSRRGSRKIEHLGSAHDGQEFEALKVVAAQRLIGGQDELDLGLEAVATAVPLPITSTRMSYLWEALCRAYESLGFAEATAVGDVVFVTWFWPGSSSRPASLTRFGCWRRSV